MYRIQQMAIISLALLGAAGCVSTQKRYDKAQDLELQGRYAEAVEYYVKVLERDEEWEGAEERLRDAGNQAIALYLDEAEAARLQGRYEEALHTLDRLDALRDAAASVGVLLDVPATYASDRETLTRQALDALLRRGEQAERAGDWHDALQAYERAERYADAPGLHTDLVRRQAHVHLQWAQRDYDLEHFRAAFDRARHVVDLAGPAAPMTEQALALQEAALEAGTRFVAFLPFWRTEEVARTAPDRVVRDLNDVLLYEHWTAALPFVAAADPVQIRRELRRLRYDREVITRRQAAQIGRIVEADYVVVGEWTELERTERNLKERTRKARMKGRGSTAGGSRDTTYTEQRFTLEYEARIAYRIVDPRTRREVDQGTVSAEVSGRVERAVFAGDYRDLDLSGSELSLFEDEERLAAQDLSDELVDTLAERLAERVYERLLQQIP